MTTTEEISREDAKTAKSKLPDGWRLVKLGDISELTGGNGAPQEAEAFAGGTIPFVRMKDVGRYRFTLSLVETDDLLTEDALRKYKMRVFPVGTILMPRSGSVYTNHRARLGVPATVVGHLAALLPRDDVFDSNFVTLALKLVDMRQWMTKTTGLDSIGFTELSEVLIPFPPLAEQKRIAGILKEQMAAVERARASAEAQLQAVENLPAAHLRAVFNNGESKSWPKKRLGDIAKTSSGSTPSRGRSDYFGGTIPWVKTGELHDGFILDTEEKVTKKALKECSLPLLPAQTLLVAMYGQGQTRGRTGLLTQPMTTNQACFAVLPNPTFFDSAFLQWWFRHSYARLRQETESRGGNQPNLNGIFLREQEVQLPPLADQSRIAAQLSSQMSSAERLRQTLTEQLDALNKLPAALLRRAFNGEI